MAPAWRAMSPMISMEKVIRGVRKVNELSETVETGCGDSALIWLGQERACSGITAESAQRH